MMSRFLLAAAVAAGFAAPAMAGPLELTTSMKVEHRVAAPDGTTRIELVAPGKVVPGDRVVVVLAYRNTGTQPLADLVLADPVPGTVAYRAPFAGSPAPEVSTDGRHFGPLAALTVTAADGTARPAGTADISHVRWRLAAPLAAGAQGQLAFQAVLK